MDEPEELRILRQLQNDSRFRVRVIAKIGVALAVTLTFIFNVWNLHRLVHWWAFWPFCPLIHSRFPALTMKPPYTNMSLSCKSCGAELKRYEVMADAMIKACLGDPRKEHGCNWPLCGAKKPGTTCKPYGK